MSGKDLRETLGFIFVAASLVFVGLEIRQNTAVARGQTRQELAALNQEWLILQSTDSVFSEIFRKAWMGADGMLTPSESARAMWAMRLNLRRLENVFFQHQQGLVDESALQSYGFQASTALMKNTRFRDFWLKQDERAAFHPDFVHVFENGSEEKAR